eukprot:6407313-Prymnesium_polylepis.2
MASRYSLRTTSAALEVVLVPKLARMVDSPADCACKRLLLGEARRTTVGAELYKLLWSVTSYAAPSERWASTLAVA